MFNMQILPAGETIAALRKRVEPLAKAPLKLSSLNNVLAGALYGRPYASVIAAERAGRTPSLFQEQTRAAREEAERRLDKMARTPDANWGQTLRRFVRELMLLTLELEDSEEQTRAIEAAASQGGEQGVPHLAPAQILTELGYESAQAEAIVRAVGRASGLVLFAGTAGSGKWTSARNAMFAKLAIHPERSLVEIEDVGTTSGESDWLQKFDAVMRSDPDSIFMGEIHSTEQAGAAIRASCAGHLVIATICASSALAALSCLNGLGVPWSDLGTPDVIAAVVYQRLVPALCPCAVADRDGKLTRNPKDCERCHGRGIDGRTACAEILVPKSWMMRPIRDSNLRELDQLWRAGYPEGAPVTAREHAMEKFAAGQVVLSDVVEAFRADKNYGYGVEPEEYVVQGAEATPVLRTPTR